MKLERFCYTYTHARYIGTVAVYLNPYEAMKTSIENQILNNDLGRARRRTQAVSYTAVHLKVNAKTRKTPRPHYDFSFIVPKVLVTKTQLLLGRRTSCARVRPPPPEPFSLTNRKHGVSYVIILSSYSDVR